MTDYIPEPEPTPEPWQQPPTQVVFPLPSILRTVVQAAVGLLFTWLVTALPGAADLLRQVQGQVVELVTYALTIGGAAFTAWLMTRPRINAALSQIGLGARPKRAA